MIQIDEFSGRMCPSDIECVTNFIDTLDKTKGDNTRRMVYSGDIRQSRIRAKLTEVFISALLDTPLDLAIYDSDDRGIDTLYKGRWVQIKRAGTRTEKRGKPWFKLELNDRHAENPPWDLGFLVEDDAEDENVFRLAGWIGKEHWIRGRKLLHWPPQSCWAVSNLAAPQLLNKLNIRTPPRPWPLQEAL